MRALEFITAHVIYNPVYTYKFQLKTTKGLEQQEREQSQSLENVVVLDDNIVPVEFKNELPTVQNICLNL